MDRYFPAPPTLPPTPPSDFAERAGRYTGTYIPNRRDRGSILKLGEFLGMLRVTAEKDGTLMVRLPAGSPAGDHIRLVEAGPDLFREVDGELDAAFLADDRGRVRHLALEQIAFDRSPGSEPGVHALVAGSPSCSSRPPSWGGSWEGRRVSSAVRRRARSHSLRGRSRARCVLSTPSPWWDSQLRFGTSTSTTC
jgi:hypothetical protein